MGIAYHGKTLKDQKAYFVIIMLRKKKIYTSCVLSGSLMLHFLAFHSSHKSKKLTL